MLADYSGVVVVAAALAAAWAVLAGLHRGLSSRDATPAEPTPRPPPPARLLVPFHRLLLAAVLVAVVLVLLFPGAAVLRELGGSGLAALCALGVPIVVGVLHGFRTGSFE